MFTSAAAVPNGTPVWTLMMLSPTGKGAGVAAVPRVSSTRSGALSWNRRPSAEGGPIVPCTSVIRSTDRWWYRQNDPAASTGTTARLATADFTAWLPFDRACGPSTSELHRSAVT